MADPPTQPFCLGIPVDHRLKPLLTKSRLVPDPVASTGDHVQEIKRYGSRLPMDREDISDDEVDFARWLAMPETKGGVVIALLQPAEHQRYFAKHHLTMEDSNSLRAVDEVCRVVAGYGLEVVSCFDAFPFFKHPMNKISTDQQKEQYEDKLDEAYAILLNMIEEKQPEVIFCCYHTPYSKKFKEFHCIGIGRTRDYKVTLRGRRYTCVNGFHPGYALNYLEDKSALRSLFLVEATQAFCRANGTWNERPWMASLRESCAVIVRINTEDTKERPKLSRHDFQRERFRLYLDILQEILISLNSEEFRDMTNDELYDFILENRRNVLMPNCLLLLVKVIDFEDRSGDRLHARGFTKLHQQEERDIRDLRRNVEKDCSDFLRSLRAAEAPFQVQKDMEGMLTLAGLNKSLLALGPSSSHSGFDYDLRASFRSLVLNLNYAYMCRGSGIYTADIKKLAEAFRIGASRFESALAQHHATSTRGGAQEEQDTISNHLQRLGIGNSPQESSWTPTIGMSQFKTVPKSSRSPPPAAQPRYTRSAAPQPAPIPSGAPRFGVVSSPSVPRAAAFSQRHSTSSCTNCQQTGHSSSKCPRTQCYRCKNFGHMSFDCPTQRS